MMGVYKHSNQEMEAEARLNNGKPSDRSFSFKDCYNVLHDEGIVTLSYKNEKGSEQLVVRPLCKKGLNFALEAREDAIKKGRIVLW